ncbi:MAG: hypothetical protein JWO36_6790 [Myxococcales bacterium]|nr:hypothetical protein [Myxococcales bacterium]
MRALLAAAVMLTFGCRYDLDHAPPLPDAIQASCTISTSSACMDAVNHSDFTWIQDNIFTKQCVFSGCHNGGNTDAGKIDLRTGRAFAHLVNVTSNLEKTRKLVVPSSSAQSYLQVMLGKIPPEMASPPAGPILETVGVMPQNNGGALLCCQKLDAIDRWITAGAMNN